MRVKLTNMVFRQLDIRPSPENSFHNLREAGHFLLVSRGKRFDFEVGKQPLHLTVGKLAAFDTGRRADAFDGRHPTQRVKAIRRQDAERAPCALEFIDFRYER